MKKGFTLVELIVSVAITAILMVGMSVFFSNSFQNLFQAQEKTEAVSGQFVLNEIIRDKFLNLESLIEQTSDHLISRNKTGRSNLPFSYIGKTTEEGKDYLVFKDFFVFNDVEKSGTDMLYGNSGNGVIQGGSQPINPPANFAGFAVNGSTYYVAVPNENAIYECNTSTCSTYALSPDIGNLNYPVDVEVSDGTLYISDAGNNRIIRHAGGASTVIEGDFKFPTGLAVDGDNLFVSDTLNNRVLKLDLADPESPIITTVVGEGENTDCNNTALYCKLNMPTGLFVDDANLYISDSGSNRILKMSDPGVVGSKPKIELDLGGSEYLDNIVVTLDPSSSINQVQTPQNSSLIAGNYQFPNSNVFEYRYFTKLVGNHSGTDYDWIRVKDNYFSNGDPIRIGSDQYNILTLVPGEPDYTYQLASLTSATYADGEKVYYYDNQTGTHSFEVQLSQPKDFYNVKVEAYRVGEGTPFFSEEKVIRNGDGILGTPEDVIEVVTDDFNISFPTGLAANGLTLHFADSLKNVVKTFAEGSFRGSTPIVYFDPNALTEFDYKSDFDLNPTSGLNFSKYNGNSILEATIRDNLTPTTTYKINAKL